MKIIWLVEIIELSSPAPVKVSTVAVQPQEVVEIKYISDIIIDKARRALLEDIQILLIIIYFILCYFLIDCSCTYKNIFIH